MDDDGIDKILTRSAVVFCDMDIKQECEAQDSQKAAGKPGKPPLPLPQSLSHQAVCPVLRVGAHR